MAKQVDLPAPLTNAKRVEVVGLQEVPTAEALATWLKVQGHDTSEWGQGDTKDVSKLWKEIKLDESGLELWETEDGVRHTVRVTHVLRAKVCSPESYRRQIFLFNTWQQFSDGRKRTRNALLSEKLTISEMPLEEHLFSVCERAVTEEEMQRVADSAFQIGPGSPAPEYDANYACPLKVVDAKQVDHTIEVEKSKSYKELLTMYHLYTVDIICVGLPSVDFNTLEFEHAKEGEVPKLKYVHAWVWLEWSLIQRYLFEGSSIKERKTKGSFKGTDALRSWLGQFNLDTSQWFKPVQQLLAEVESQSTNLEHWGRHDGTPLLMRVVHVIQLQVCSSDPRLSGKFLFNTWQQMDDGRVRTINRLLARKLSTADVPFNLERFVSFAMNAVKQELTHLVDQYFQMGSSVLPGRSNVADVEVTEVEFLDHRVDVKESPTFKGMNTLYHLYTLQVECDGLPLADFASLEFRDGHAHCANGWRWVTWQQCLDIMHGRHEELKHRADRLESAVSEQVREVQACAAAFSELEQAYAHHMSMDLQANGSAAPLRAAVEAMKSSMARLQGATQSFAGHSQDKDESSVKMLPPAMVSKITEASSTSKEFLDEARWTRISEAKTKHGRMDSRPSISRVLRRTNSHEHDHEFGDAASNSMGASISMSQSLKPLEEEEVHPPTTLRTEPVQETQETARVAPQTHQGPSGLYFVAQIGDCVLSCGPGMSCFSGSLRQLRERWLRLTTQANGE
mmetsp:Transcript_22616/g.52736  ORF Transcript_22616/g.52736 Transcript_22616/m.52736 type:complete len:735 (+) Transcript_22616:138-2342(+)